VREVMVVVLKLLLQRNWAGFQANSFARFHIRPSGTIRLDLIKRPHHDGAPTKEKL
jgi:hypothetical protein